ncbi:PAS domain S-box protein [Kaarinaea lacus]
MEKTRFSLADNYYRTLLDASNDAILVLESNSGTILYANQKFIDWLGYSKDQWNTSSLSSLICHDVTVPAAADISQLCQKLSSLQKERIGQCQIQAINGNRYWVEVRLKPVQLDDNTRILAIIQNISEFKRNETRLQDSEKNWRSIAENVPDIIIVTDRYGIIQFVNKVFPGHDINDVVGRSTFDFQPAEYHEAMRHSLEQVFTKGEVVTLETVGAGSPGELRHYVSRFSPIKENNQVVAALLIATDVTEQINAQQALHQSEEKFKKAFYASPDVIAITRLADGKIIEINDSFEHITGYNKREAIGRTTLELNIYADPRERQRLIDQLRDTRSVKDFPWSLRTKTGELRDCLISSEVFAFGEEVYMVSVIRDITNTKIAEQALRSSESSLRKAQEIANLGNWSINLQTNEVTWSDNLYRIYGFNKGDYNGDVWDIIFQTIHPEDRAKLDDALRHIKLASKPKWQMDYRIIRPDGELRYLWSNGEFLYDDNGKPVKVVGIVQDVTERELNQQELQRSRTELKQRNLSLSTINTIADRVFRAGDVTAVAREAVHAIAEFANSPSITFYRVDKHNATLDLVYTTESNQTMVNAVRQLPLEGTISGRAVEERKIFDVEDIANDNRLHEGAKNFAQQQGYVSAVCLPTIFNDEVLGIINFAYKKPHRLSRAEHETFLSIGKSIGLALANARHIAQLEVEMRDRQQAEETLRNIAVGVSAATGDEFFRSLVTKFAHTFAVDYAFLGELDKSTHGKIKTIAVCVNGAIADNFEYDLKDTPCESVMNNQPCVISNSVQQEFPNDLLLQKMGVEGYVGTPLHDSNGSIIGIFVALHSEPLINADLMQSMLQIFAVRAAAEMERISGEAALRRSEEHLRLALNSSNVGTWEWDIPSGEVTWSQNVERIFHVIPGSFRGGYSEYLDLIHPEDLVAVKAAIDDALKGIRTYAVEHRIKCSCEGECWIYCQGEVHRDGNGNPVRMLGTVSDVSERKNAELRVKASQKMLQLILDTIPVRVFWKDLNSVYLGCNKLFAQDAGIQSAQQIIGKTDFDMVWREQAEQYRADDRQVIQSGVPKVRYEEPQSQQNKTRWLETSKIPLTDLNGNIIGMLGTYSDITERKQALEDKRRSEQRLILHFQQTPLAVIEWNNDMEIVEWNQAAEGIFGYSHDEAVGQNVLELIVPKQKRLQIDNVASSLLHAQGGRRNINENITKDGKSIICDWYNTPLVDENGQVMGVASAAMDITERVKTAQELEQYREHLEELVEQRTDELTRVNKELEAFSYSVSHDLRAPLRSIDGFSQVLVEDYFDKLDEEGKDYLQRVRQGAQRMAQLIDDMLKLSRLTRSHLQHENINISELATEICTALQKEASDRTVQFDITPNVFAYGDEGLLTVVLDNLISNAWKYTSKTSHGVIEVGALADDKETTYWVKDNGAGFNMKYVDKLFGAFQRLHHTHEFEGSGIGLATVARIIHRHGGRVWAEGVENQGATFYFTLPNRPNKTNQ